MKQFEEFEQQFVFEVLANPDYRLGQALLIHFQRSQKACTKMVIWAIDNRCGCGRLVHVNGYWNL